MNGELNFYRNKSSELEHRILDLRSDMAKLEGEMETLQQIVRFHRNKSALSVAKTLFSGDDAVEREQ